MSVEQKKSIQPEQFTKTIRLIHLAMSGGTAMYFVVSIFLNFMHDKTNDDLTLIMIAPLIILSSTILGYVLFNKKTNAIKASDQLSSKLAAFSTAFIIRMACHEGAALFTIMSYILTGSIYGLVMAIGSIVLLIMLFPTNLMIEEKAKLTNADKKIVGI